MLRALPRVIVAFALATSTKAALPDAIVGSWRNDNEERFTEMQIRKDGGFASLSRNDAIIAVIPLREQSGTWQLHGTRLTVDAAEPHTHERTQKRLQIIDVTDRALRVRTLDGHIDTYRRLRHPTCLGTEVRRRDGGVSIDAAVGRWRGHYRTHDLELSLNRGGRAIMGGSDPGHAYHASGVCTWQLRSKTLTLLPVKEEDRQGPIEWILTAMSRDCFSFTDHSGMVYTLQRVR
jgi:hypothetical protein